MYPAAPCGRGRYTTTAAGRGMLAHVVDLGTWALLFALLGGIGGGFVNSVAGGGTLVTFPMLTAIGIPPLDANITNAVALSPGYAGGTYAQRRDFLGRRDLARALAITSILGGVTGAALLLATGEELFEQLVPWLIFSATALLAFQGPLRRLTVGARGDTGAGPDVRTDGGAAAGSAKRRARWSRSGSRGQRSSAAGMPALITGPRR